MIDEHKPSEIQNLPKGEYFRFKINGPVWVRDDYDRSSKSYQAYKFDDINHFTYKKKGTSVYYGFNF